jgi:predicted MPP superfamily phosphohydrolase
MKLRLNRRQFFRAALWGTPLLAAADAAFVEPRWLKVKRLNLAIGTSGIRFVHFTDLHHKGDREWLVSVVSTINACKPEFVCFTGDLIEESQHLSETLELLQQIQAPLYGVPGNHDYWSGADFEEVAKGFEKTGGAWLIDRSVAVAQGRVHLHGLSCEKGKILPPIPGVKNVLLAHYPNWCEKLAPHRFDLMLAGHSHGGQVRLPFYGALVVPFGVDDYELGRFDTPAGPLYVGAGIGTFYLDVRFNCRPEITLIEI